MLHIQYVVSAFVEQYTPVMQLCLLNFRIARWCVWFSWTTEMLQCTDCFNN